MYRLDREEFVEKRYIPIWAVLAFQAGFINAFGFLACGRYVSHVTGFGTQIGIALGQKNPWFGFELLGFPFFFILGAFFSGLLTAARIERGLRPRFDLVTLLLPTTILALTTLGIFGLFGPFEEQLVLARDFVLLFSLSFVCGMQNGCFATLTKGQIRTTHLTGISTDIGTDLARVWFGKLDPIERSITKKVNLSRIITLVCFASGSILSALVSEHIGYVALCVPALTSIVVFFEVRHISDELDRKFAPQRRALRVAKKKQAALELNDLKASAN